jgi:protein-S-isoprenylcysteine O-methyltransferase Ste14
MSRCYFASLQDEIKWKNREFGASCPAFWSLAEVTNKSKQTEMHARVKVQPVFLALIHIVTALVLRWLIPLPLVVPPVLASMGFVLVILGFLLGMAALLAFRRGRTTSAPGHLAVRLITSGIYRFSRNPIYLGFLLMLIGIPLNGGSYWGLFLAPVMVTLFGRLVIEQEEEILAKRFGDEYGKYRAQVRRWI